MKKLANRNNPGRRETRTVPFGADTHTSSSYNLVSCHVLQVMEWRKDQARREGEAEELTSGGGHGSRQAVNVRKRGSQI